MRSLPKLSMKVDFPAPGTPVMPMRTDFPVYGIILFSKSSACSRCSAFRLSTSVMALPSIRLLPDLIPFISSSLEIFIFSNVQKTIFRLQKYLYFRAQIFTNEKRILTVMVSGIFMVSCSQKGTAVQAGSKVSESDRIAQGKVIFDNSCGKCHDLPDPKSHNDDEWIGIVNIMAKK